MDLSLLLTQTKTALDIAKFIKSSQDTLDKSEQKLKLAELIEALADIKMETAEIKSMIIDKDEEIIQLKKQLQLKNDLEYEAPYYWMNNGKNDKDGPFCQKCYDVDKQLIRLQKMGNNDLWSCHNCLGKFKGKYYRVPSLTTSYQRI